MKRFASVRFDGVLDTDERDDVMRAYCSAGTAGTSWATSGKRTYATFARTEGASELPALAVLRAAPDAPRLLERLCAAFTGAGRLAGISDAYRDGDGLVIEFDPSRTPLALVVAAIDAELAAAPGRSIEALVPLDDATLTAYAGNLLGEPALDRSRLIETYLEPLIAASRT